MMKRCIALCHECNGSGIFGRTYRGLPFLGGRSVDVPCSLCGGSGRLVCEAEYVPYSRDFAEFGRKVICISCEGRGKNASGEKCQTCNGTGRLVHVLAGVPIKPFVEER